MSEKILNASILITLNCMFLMGNKKSCAVCNGKGKIELLDSSCPFCNIMMSDGIKSMEKDISVLDVAQMIEKAENL